MNKPLEFLFTAILWGLVSSSPFALIGAIWAAQEKRERTVVSIVLAFVGVSLVLAAGYWLWREFIYSPPPFRAPRYPF